MMERGRGALTGSAGKRVGLGKSFSIIRMEGSEAVLAMSPMAMPTISKVCFFNLHAIGMKETPEMKHQQL